MGIFSTIGDTISGIIQGFNDITAAVFSAMDGLVNGLEYVDKTIISMKNLDVMASAGEYSYPVVQAVATIKYLIPTDIFYFLYLFILIGITLAIYKIISYILTTLFQRIITGSGGFSSSSILSGFANKFR